MDTLPRKAMGSRSENQLSSKRLARRIALTRLLGSLTLSVFAVEGTAVAWASDTLTSSPGRLIVPFSPGGLLDIIARVIASRLASRLGHPVVVDNRPGAGGTIGLRMLVDAPADGRTMAITVTSTMALGPLLYPDSAPDPLRDLKPVAEIAEVPCVLVVNEASDLHTLAELLAKARADPGGIAYSTPGVGTTGHLAVQWLSSQTGIHLLHVPYKGGAPSVTALLANEVTLTIATFPTLLPFLSAGKLRALATTTAKRMPELPTTPAIAETVPGYEFTSRIGIVVSSPTPDAIVSKLHGELANVMADTDIRERLVRAGAIPLLTTSSEFRSDLVRQIERWGPLVAPPVRQSQ
jgi:tripartite-type tricarboxylate transporter receptor subunit TctC